VESQLIANIQQAQFSQLFCILDFTSSNLSHAMKVHRDSTQDYVVRGVFDVSSVAGSGSSSQWCRMDGQTSCADYWNPRADVVQDAVTGSNLLHHKYSILDEGQPGAVVMTGSHNYSVAANTINDENTVVVHDYKIANIYYQEWYKRYKESGGTFTAGVGLPGPGARAALEQSVPNPMTHEAMIRYSIPGAGLTRASLRVYDASGRLVRTLLDGPSVSGSQHAVWDGRTSSGATAPNGIYFYRLCVGGENLTRKLSLVR
jgi:hypothetical protein